MLPTKQELQEQASRLRRRAEKARKEQTTVGDSLTMLSDVLDYQATIKETIIKKGWYRS